MATQKTILEPGNFYHIYNRGINGCAIFTETTNYEHFFRLYDKYIFSIANTYAWVLMGNHFHFLVRIKEGVVYKYPNADRSMDAVRFEDVKWETTNDLSACNAPDSVKRPDHSKHFSHLFNAYAKYFNKKYNRHGSLFERPFERKLIDNEENLRQLIIYIHNNPVHHGFCEHPVEYPWSSYLTCVSVKPTKLHREAVIGWFDNEANFKYMHDKNVEIQKIEMWLEL